MERSNLDSFSLPTDRLSLRRTPHRWIIVGFGLERPKTSLHTQSPAVSTRETANIIYLQWTDFPRLTPAPLGSLTGGRHVPFGSRARIWRSPAEIGHGGDESEERDGRNLSH